MRKTIFANDYFYHVYQRGVEKRDIFMNEKNYFRFIHDLYEFNDKSSVNNVNFRFNSNYENYGSSAPIVGKQQRKKRNLLVDILCFNLMPNHFHLLIKQLVDNGISLFMHKLGTGYTNYFNLKYKRVGPLFQGKFKAIQIENENYLLHLSRYIHINSVKLIEPNWKEEGVKDWKKVNQFLESYRWSSYLDYIGKKNFPSVTQRELINTYFKKPEDYQKFVTEFLLKDLEKIEDLLIEK